MDDTQDPRSAEYDVVIVGGGAAGLAGALQLARSRRSVLVVDGGEPRNAPAEHMHAYLGHDGRPPGEFLEIARAEVRGYGGEVVRGSVVDVIADPGVADAGDAAGGAAVRFRVALAGGTALTARRVLIATGLVDELPAIPGVAEQWGRGVIHCPFCHGWEVRDQRIVVIATGPMAAHQALLFRQLSDRVTVVEHVAGTVAADDRERLIARGVRFEDGSVAEVVSEAVAEVAGGHDGMDAGRSPSGDVRGVRLADGRTVDADAVVVAPRFVSRTAPFRSLGLEPAPSPMGVGELLTVDARGTTAVPGVYAAGNVVDHSQQVLQAAADGARTGAMINADLAHEDAATALAAAR